jgi:hypothetical protein
VPIGHLPIEQQGQPFRMGERCRLGRGRGFAECLGHAEQAELVEVVRGSMGEHVVSSMVIVPAPDSCDGGSTRY